MDTRNANESRNRWAGAVRAATLVVVLGTLAVAWRPTHPDTAPVVTDGAPAAAATAPDMSVYFPDRFPAPQGPVEPLPPTF